MSMRTPLKSVRHLGSAKEGTDHFWKQRLTAIANFILAIFVVWLLVTLAGASHEETIAKLGEPITAVALILFLISVAVHMRLGLQTVIEDYIHHEGGKLAALIANTFVAIATASIGIFAVLKLSFGG